MARPAIDRGTDTSQPLEKLHDNERLKSDSRYLRGTIAEGLRDTATRAMPGLDPLLLKFHGIYQQDNRDQRADRARRKLEPNYQFMVRLRIPGGLCSVDQWRGLAAIADRYAEGSLRVTTRQTMQIHGVRKPALKACMQAIKALGLDTIAACGDDSRGVVCGINPALSALHAEVLALARQASDALIPSTSAYAEIWYDEARPATQSGEEEPFYGPLYLPRKFKVGFVIPPLNDIDVFGQDVGFIAIAGAQRLEGFNVCVGGGMGRIDSRTDSYPRLAEVVGYVDKHDAVGLARTVMGIQRDYGNRVDRHQARFKYTLDRLGTDWFLAELAERRGKALAPARAYRFESNGDRVGWQQGTDGEWHATLFLPSGRITGALKGRLDGFLERYGGVIRLTANQNLVLSGVGDEERAEMAWRLSDLGLDKHLEPKSQQVHSLACVGLPTCGLAMAESERILPAFLRDFESLKARHGLAPVPVTLRITGCPNGCARPYLAEVALTGRSPGRYNLYLGGGFHGQRLNVLHARNLTLDAVLAELDGLLERFAHGRADGEYFGDWLQRSGVVTRLIPSNASTGEAHG